MAYDMRQSPKRHRTLDTWLLDDLQKIESVVGSCFEGLGFLQRKATVMFISLAAKCASGAEAQIELNAEGWRLSPDCSEASDSVQAQTVAPTVVEPTEDLASMIEKSYARDYNSQRARMALRRERVEADDKYFIDEDDDTEVSPVLERFREESRYQLISV